MHLFDHTIRTYMYTYIDHTKPYNVWRPAWNKVAFWHMLCQYISYAWWSYMKNIVSIIQHNYCLVNQHGSGPDVVGKVTFDCMSNMLCWNYGRTGRTWLEASYEVLHATTDLLRSSLFCLSVTLCRQHCEASSGRLWNWPGVKVNEDER